MLTRIEINGFKTFEEFALDVPPFLVILGPNAVGKSNLFDAIHLLSRLAESDCQTAFQNMRGRPLELFRHDSTGHPGKRIDLAVELLVDKDLRDRWGQEAKLDHTRFRYELSIVRASDDRGLERLLVGRERVAQLFSENDRWGNYPVRVSDAFRNAYIRYGSPKPDRTFFSGTLSVIEDEDSDGTWKQWSLPGADATQLSGISSISSDSTIETRILFAIREELRSWRLLQLNPAVLRLPSPRLGPDKLLEDGSNLAAALARIRARTKTETRLNGILPDIAAELNAIVPEILGIKVAEDAQEYRIEFSAGRSADFNARVASDGTLRVLALLAMLHDPDRRGLICLEEPENGVHPGRLKALIQHIRDLTSDPQSPDQDPEEPLSQVLINSHSPVVLSAVGEDAECVFADLVTVVDPATGTTRRKTRMRPVSKSGRTTMPAAESSESSGQKDSDFVTSLEVRQYLDTVRSPDDIP